MHPNFGCNHFRRELYLLLPLSIEAETEAAAESRRRKQRQQRQTQKQKKRQKQQQRPRAARRLWVLCLRNVCPKPQKRGGSYRVFLFLHVWADTETAAEAAGKRELVQQTAYKMNKTVAKNMQKRGSNSSMCHVF